MTPELQQILRDTSRSFYLTVRVLPASVRAQIGIAYLLARATDTIADTDLVPVNDRLAALEQLRLRILGKRAERCDFSGIAAAQSQSASPAERLLLERIEETLGQLAFFSGPDLVLIRAVLETITGGQALDLQRFGAATGESIRALKVDEELDDYTYRVAGCVGEFWTKLTRRHCFAERDLDDEQFLADGIRFGKGLQLVNILRDMPRDLRQGRCYFPETALSRVGLTPADLLDPKSWETFRPVYSLWLQRAYEHLEAGWRYTNTLPSGQYRLRLGCGLPILLGVGTLQKLRNANVLEPGQRVKVSRKEVRSLLWSLIWRMPFRPLWRRQFTSL